MGSPLSNSGNAAQSSQNGISSGAALQAQMQQAAAMQNMAGQMQNQIGQIIPYQGQAPQILQGQQSGLSAWQPSIYVQQGTAIITSNGSYHHPAASIQELEEAELLRKAELKKRFLTFPPEQREAFLNMKRAWLVHEGMNPTFFGTNRSPNELSLAEYEEVHASACLEAAVFGDEDE